VLGLVPSRVGPGVTPILAIAMAITVLIASPIVIVAVVALILVVL
jgi:hypothetical protein